MTERYPSVADLMRKRRSLVEEQLIKPFWSPQSVFSPKQDHRPRAN